MYKSFDNFMKRHSNAEDKLVESSTLDYFLYKYGGKSFKDGLYRVFTKEEMVKWKDIITKSYIDFKGEFSPFSYDWLGRCFALDQREDSSHKGMILMFEIGTADVLEIPCDLLSFHNDEIPVYVDACLAVEFFKKWKKIDNSQLKMNQCVGYKIPLFLGGEDTVENLEISDMEVYWHVLSSIKNKY
jgi:hypothetical protein